MGLNDTVVQIVTRRKRPLRRSDILDALEKSEGFRRDKISGVLNKLAEQKRIKKKYSKDDSVFVFSAV